MRLSTATNSSQQTNTENASSNNEPAASNISGSLRQQTEAIVPLVPVISSVTTRTEVTGSLVRVFQQQQTALSVDQNRQPIDLKAPIVDVDEPLQFERPDFAKRIVMPLPMEEIKEEQEDDEMEWENFENEENICPN